MNTAILHSERCPNYHGSDVVEYSPSRFADYVKGLPFGLVSAYPICAVCGRREAAMGDAMATVHDYQPAIADDGSDDRMETPEREFDRRDQRQIDMEETEKYWRQ